GRPACGSPPGRGSGCGAGARPEALALAHPGLPLLRTGAGPRPARGPEQAAGRAGPSWRGGSTRRGGASIHRVGGRVECQKSVGLPTPAQLLEFPSSFTSVACDRIKWGKLLGDYVLAGEEPLGEGTNEDDFYQQTDERFSRCHCRL